MADCITAVVGGADRLGIGHRRGGRQEMSGALQSGGFVVQIWLCSVLTFSKIQTDPFTNHAHRVRVAWRGTRLTTEAAPASNDPSSAAEAREKGHIGLVVLGAIGAGLLLGLLLVLVLFAGGPEHEITGTALIALGAGFVLLAVGSSRFSDQPQTWALIPGVAVALVGLAVWALSPSEHTLAVTGWVWPLALLVLVVWSVRGARHDLHNWSPMVALPGSTRTVACRGRRCL